MNTTISRRSASKLIAMGTASVVFHPLLNSQNKLHMQTRLIPGTNAKIPVIGLGTWQTFDVGMSEEERAPLKKVLQALIDHGGSVIDSSPMYGRSEQVVGDLTQSMGIKGQIFEATKVWTSGKDQGIFEMERSMQRMGANPMDLMQIHNLLDWKVHLRTLKQWKEEGKIRFIGITHYHSGGYAEMEHIMKTEELDFIQINYNLAVQDAAKRILPLAKDKGIAVLINRPYEGGVLFKKSKGKDLPAWANEIEVTSWGQFFLKFILAHPAVTCIIPGTSIVKHMLDNVQAGFGALPHEHHQKKMTRLFSR